MVTTERAVAAVRASARSSEEKGNLLAFVGGDVEDEDDDETITAFLRAKAKVAGAGLGVWSATGAADGGAGGAAAAAGAAAGLVVESAAGAGLEYSPTELLRSALPAADVAPQMWSSCPSSSEQQAHSYQPAEVLHWKRADPEAGAGDTSGGGTLAEAICDHQEAANALYGPLRLLRPPHVGALNSEAQVASALALALGVFVLDKLAASQLSSAAGGGASATWHQQPPATIIQGSAIYDNESGSVHEQASGSGGSATAPSSISRSSLRRLKMDLVLCLVENNSRQQQAVVASAAAAAGAAAVLHDPGGGGEHKRPPEAAAAELLRPGGSQGGGSFGAGAASTANEAAAPAARGLEAGGDAGQPAPKRRQCSRCVCVGEVKTVSKLMQASGQPVDLLAAWKNTAGDAHHALAQAIISQIYTYMQCWGICFGFISCWYGTWLVYCPLANRRRLYLSDAFLAATQSPPPGRGESAATTYGAVTYVQWRALSSNYTQQLQQAVDVYQTTGRGPAAARGGGGGDGGGGRQQHGGDDSGSAEEPDAGACSGSGDLYSPTSGELARATSVSHTMRYVRDQELHRSTATALEPASPAATGRATATAVAVAAAQQPVSAAASAAAQQGPAAVTATRPQPLRGLLQYHQELSPGSEGKVLSGTYGGVPCIIKLLGPDRHGLAACQREVQAYEALQPQQGSLVPELLASDDLSWGVKFIATRMVDGEPLSRQRPIPAAVAAAAVSTLQALQAACAGFVHGDIRLENVLLVAAAPSAGNSAGPGVGEVDGGGGDGRSAGTPPRCVLLDFGRSRLDGDAAAQQRELAQLQQLVAARRQ